MRILALVLVVVTFVPSPAAGAGAPAALAARSAPAVEVPIAGYAVDPAGQVRISVESSADSYYVLFVRGDSEGDDFQPASMALGVDGTTVLTEGLAAYPLSHYRVEEYSLASPGDLDGDGIDDVAEWSDLGRLAPFNPAAPVAPVDGTTAIPDRATFEALSYEGTQVAIDLHLRDLEFVKFYLLDADTDQPRVYFMNTETHRAHSSFARVIGIPRGGGGRGNPTPGVMRGEIVYHPHVVGPNGTMGVYRFEFEPNDSYPFADVEMAYEVFARNMPLLRNDWAYYPMPNRALPRYWEEKALYDASRVAILLEDDVLAGVGYVPLNVAEGYGRLTVMALDERPHPRDIVVYEALPNDLPRVGGIITTVPQTPLSHVNLRAIQDGVPNAYIANALDDDAIAGLIGRPVYYRVGQTEYELREATLAEVEAHYAARRPTVPQVPARDLGRHNIASLDEIGFNDFDAFGVKAANVATLRTFGFPEGTVPTGFAVPFYFYDEFMKHNGFYDDVRTLLADPLFVEDFDVQEQRLAELRERIEAGDMPPWMMDQLAALQAAFPAGTPIRCRSSTNNEDLPGFSGAGLYDSYTQHPDEGHIEKSIKQVYASLWNYRAFDERQFYRIDHLATAMGVLVHQNYESELANGVGVTTDPIFETADTYYLNTQVGEDLVTNPEALSVPEEILLGAAPGSGYTVLRASNLVEPDQMIMSERHLEELRGYLAAIEAGFAALYRVGPGEPFAMEIEYKVTRAGRLAIKQARPWLFEGSRPPIARASTVYLPMALTSVSPQP